MSVVVVDNGEDYSDHIIYFIEAGDVATDEVVRVLGGNHPDRYFAIGRAERFDWLGSAMGDDVAYHLGAADLLTVTDSGVPHYKATKANPHREATYGEVDDAKARRYSRALLQRCADLWGAPDRWVYEDQPARAKTALRAMWVERGLAMKRWLDAHPEHVEPCSEDDE